MRVLVCGGRDFLDRAFVIETLDKLHSEYAFSCLIEGGAKGVDRFALEWAVLSGVETETYKAEWNKHQKVAEIANNRIMLAEGKPDLVVAFLGGRGTQHMVSISENAGIKIIKPRKN